MLGTAPWGVLEEQLQAPARAGVQSAVQPHLHHVKEG